MEFYRLLQNKCHQQKKGIFTPRKYNSTLLVLWYSVALEVFGHPVYLVKYLK